MWSKIPAGVTVLVLAGALVLGAVLAHNSLEAPAANGKPARGAVAEVGR
jgi:hypothetical protein